jgi:hypothetical protein
VISNPALGPGIDSKDGVGDTVFTAFLSRRNPGSGSGVQVRSCRFRPISSSEARQQELGDGAVIRRAPSRAREVRGYTALLVNNVWSLTSNKNGGAYNNGLVQPFVNYNFDGRLYLTSAPILTVDWKADSGQQWTVPVGGGVGKIFHLASCR